MQCSECFKENSHLICLPMYGYLCGSCYQEIIHDYLK